MRFLLVATFAWPDHFGGAERVIGEVARRLVRRGHAVTLLTSRAHDLPAREERDGIEVRRYPVDRSSPVRFYRSVFTGVRAALRARDLPTADVQHLHQMLSGVAALTAPLSVRVPRICSFYAPYNEEYLARFRQSPSGAVPLHVRAVSTLLRRGDRALLQKCRQVIVLSRFTLAQVEALAPDALARTSIAPPGVDLARFTPAGDERMRAAAAASFGLPADGTPLLLSVRRLVPRMGLPDLIEAARRLTAAGRRLHVALAGDGEQREELERTAAAAGLADRCTFLGRVAEARLPDLYRAASVFVLPTRCLEGFGMATAEALASGLPVVATDAGASPELLSGVDGCALVRPGDPAALGKALAALLDDPDRRARAALAARRHAEQHLHWDSHVLAVEVAAQRALAGGTAAQPGGDGRNGPRAHIGQEFPRA